MNFGLPFLSPMLDESPAAAAQFQDWQAKSNSTWAKNHRPDGTHDTVQERGRSVAMGDWIAVPFGSVLFAGTAAAWTVPITSVTTLRYTLIGHSLIYSFFIAGTSVTAGSLGLLLPLPKGFTAAMPLEAPFFCSDNGTLGTGIARILPGESSVSLFNPTATNWTASAGATTVAGQLIIEIIQ